LCYHSVLWYNKDMAQDKLGRFIKGTHWRPEQPFWDKEWLNIEYHQKDRSAIDIANQFGITEGSILFWLRKLGIKRKTMAEIRQRKHWGLSGKQNGMYGKTGKKNPNWDGGHSPERQSQYARSAWKELAKSILKRDNYKCQKCGVKNKLVVHHIKKWSRYPDLRFTSSNLETVCKKCHKLLHKKRSF